MYIPYATPAAPASAAPDTNVTTIVRSTSMPMSAAVSRSSATARIAVPVFVRWMKRYSRTMKMIDIPIRNSLI